MAAWILIPAQPTPTILAATTGHVIISKHFLDSCFTLRAITDVYIIRCPSIKLSIYICITLFRVPSLSTLETHFITALTIHSIGFSFQNKSVAVGSCALFKVWVCTDINVFLELKVFLEDLLRSKLSYIFSGILSSAAGICAFNFINFSISYVECYIVCHAIQAESMRAHRNSMKILFVIVFIAYIASTSTLCHRLDLSFSNIILNLST